MVRNQQGIIDMEKTEKELLKEMHQSLKILEQRFVEGLIGEEIAIGLFGEERTKELKEKITKH